MKKFLNNHEMVFGHNVERKRRYKTHMTARVVIRPRVNRSTVNRHFLDVSANNRCRLEILKYDRD